MMTESVKKSPEPAPVYIGLRYLDMETEVVSSVMINYSYNGVRFFVLASVKEIPQGYELDQSVEGKILIELSDLSWGEESEQKDIRIDNLHKELASLAGDACLSLMRELAPLPIPNPRTLEEQLYPEAYTLQVLTEGGKLISHKLDGYELPERYPPIPETRVQEIGLDESLLVLKPSQIILGTRLQSLVWKVNVNGDDMICKIAIDIFGDAISEELETYQKIRKAEVGDDLRVPELKGIVRSRTGVIGILLNYIPHKHHSLRVLLRQVEDGAVPETEATTLMKRQWAGQIKQSLARLHNLGILWRDVKTDNILIDENNDAVLIDFGGETLSAGLTGISMARWKESYRESRRYWKPSGRIICIDRCEF